MFSKTRIVSGVIAFSCSLVVSVVSVFGATINATNVNFRTKPSMKSKVIRTLNKGTKVSISKKTGSWYKVKVGKRSGYVKSTYVRKEPTKKGICVASVVNVRKTPSLKGKVVAKIKDGKSVTILKTKGKWYKIKAGSKVGYSVKKYIKIKSSKSSRGNSYSSKGQSVVDYAKRFLGTRYRYGGTSPSGFDCSGLVYYCYQHMGVTLNRSASGMSSNGRAVSKSDLRPGDIVLFRSGGRYSHAGLYIGGGKMIHAETRSGVNIDSIWGTDYYRVRYAGARRIFS